MLNLYSSRRSLQVYVEVRPILYQPFGYVFIHVSNVLIQDGQSYLPVVVYSLLTVLFNVLLSGQFHELGLYKFTGNRGLTTGFFELLCCSWCVSHVFLVLNFR